MDFLCSHIASLVIMKWLLWGLPFVSFVPVHGSFREMTLGKTGITRYQEYGEAGTGGPSCPPGGCDSESGMRAPVSVAGPQQFRMLECLHTTPCCRMPVGFRDGYHICQIVGEAYEGQSWSQDGESGKVWAVNPTSHRCLGLTESFLIYPCYKAGCRALVCNMWCMTG